MSIVSQLRDLAERWKDVPAGERANYQLYLTELAAALDVPTPQPKGSGYEFEYPVQVVNADGSTTTKFVDLYRAGHFVLEAKDEDSEESSDILLRKAFGQARQYAAWIDGDPPPYLLVIDVGRTLVVWDRWKGTYGDFHAGYRIHMPTLAERPDDIALLRDIWTNPSARDPRGRSEAVTKEIAEKLAELASRLEDRGYVHGEVARFLIRCVFTMFAEDTGLLKGSPFTQAIEEIGLESPAEFQEALEELWRAMDEGGRFGLHKFLRFNGHFFKEHSAIPLTKEDLVVLLEAAHADWTDVEPTIMGTLFTRALDPKERHRLGAEFTPREYVERLVRPTVEEPIRERWTRVQAEVLQLRSRNGKAESTRKKHEREALKRLREFHNWLRGLRFLDPACGSGNFLYVALRIIKEIELEVLQAIREITGQPEIAVEEVGPWQFYGIEVDRWAREIAELTLWIGYHQFWFSAHGHTLPPEPVLRDTKTLECRDAVLVWDRIEEDPSRSEPDPTPRIKHPVTGELVPDPEAKRPYHVHVNPRKADWPEADFIIGNPPYMGRGRQREAFGNGYVDALRDAYPEVPDNADYVMYWWYRAADEVASGRTIRAGLITTNTITQRHNREVIEDAAEKEVRVCWAIPDHPWVDEKGSADVRVAMTVVAKDPGTAVRVDVDKQGNVAREITVPILNADLTAYADVAGASQIRLLANKGLSSQGFTLVGAGFRLQSEEGERLLASDEAHKGIVRPIVNGRDLTQRPRGIYTIDFGLMEEDEARQYPVLYDLVRDRVKPQRDAQRRERRKRYWWRYGEPTIGLREALEGLERYIVTPETAKHRVFRFLPVDVAAEHSVVCIALEDAYFLGVLSSRIHVEWALAAGGRLGVGNDPRYQKAQTFDAFPFPSPEPELREKIADLAERLDQHRADGLARNERVTITGMYNVLEKLRSSEPLTDDDRQIHEIAACGMLRDLHDELDRLVAKAYDWEWPLETEEILSRLVALHDERVREEQSGVVKWLRPNYQMPRFGEGAVEAEQELDLATEGKAEPDEPREWPATAIEQIAALQSVLVAGPLTVEEAATRFRGARRDHVARHLETLEIMGEARREPDGAYQLVRNAVVPA